MRSAAWAGYAARAWALSFAAIHFYWGAGGTAGIDTIGSAVTDLADNLWLLAIGLWGVVFVVLGLIALVRPWGLGIPRRLLLVPTGAPGSMPSDWTHVRTLWEYGHAAGAALLMGGSARSSYLC